MVHNLVFRMEAGSYQAGRLLLCSYIIWSSWSPLLLYMIWYSGAHWSMAKCSVSFFTSYSYLQAAQTGSQSLNTRQHFLFQETINVQVKWVSMDCYGTETKPGKTQVLSHSAHMQHNKSPPVTLSLSLCICVFSLTPVSLSLVIFCIKYEYGNLTETSEVQFQSLWSLRNCATSTGSCSYIAGKFIAWVFCYTEWTELCFVRLLIGIVSLFSGLGWN